MTMSFFRRKKIISTYVLPLLAIAALAFMVQQIIDTPETAIASPAFSPSESSYNKQVAGVGVVEPKSEIVKIGTNISGIITKVYIEAGQKVLVGDKLFTVDEREAKSQLTTAEAAHAAAKARLDDAEYKLSLYNKLTDKRAVSEQEISQTEYNAQIARAEAKQTAAKIQEIRTTLDRLTVKSPIAAEVLKVNARAGEYAPAGIVSEPLITLGDTETLHVRVQIDETDAQRFDLRKPAKASLRSNTQNNVALNFVRVEPLVRAKQNLTGSGNEKVDTRVLEVIYSFDNSKIRAFPGQQMDVYINAE